VLAREAGIAEKVFNEMMELMVSQSDAVERFTFSSFLEKTTKWHYWQSYQAGSNNCKRNRKACEQPSLIQRLSNKSA